MGKQVIMSTKLRIWRYTDHNHILATKWKPKVGGEENENGEGEKHTTEVEVLSEELVELESESEKEAERQNEAKKAAASKEKKTSNRKWEKGLWRGLVRQARDKMRQKEEGKKETKWRRSAGGALEWLKEKGESLRERKEKELQDKKELGSLENKDLENKDLENVDPENTDPKNADLENADLKNADIENWKCCLLTNWKALSLYT